ncbi:hypothetical protein EBT31_19375 [bacterium]|nr:hypothetical protein [bacterium]NBX51857.1 hypothetical protein [bacterium]
MLDLNPNAADQICFMLDVLATATDHLITIDGGSYSLIDRMVSTLQHSKRITFRTNTTVEAFAENPDNIEVLFDNGQKVTCDHIIFTCPKPAYAKIDGFPKDIQAAMDSVMVVELFKIFIVLDHPPFDEHTLPKPNDHADKIPCREIHYSYDKVSKTGMVMIYGDSPSINYWRPFLQQRLSDQPFMDGNPHLCNHLYHYLRQIFPSSHNSFSIRHYGILDWSNEPYGSGVHLWKPGCISQNIMAKLRAFGNGRVHICGETYSDYQGFIEGCLRTVNGVLETIPSETPC